MTLTTVRSKRYQVRVKAVNLEKRYGLEEAVRAMKQIEPKKFDETVSLNFQLSIPNPEQLLRGTTSLPHGSGKKLRVICFVKGEGVRDAQEAGADEVGAEDLVQKVQGGWMDFDAVVAHPDMMREVSKLGKVLGPKGLMPSPKTGSVTPQVGRAVKELKAGRIEFKSDKTGGLHAICGKLSFSENHLIENAKNVLRAVSDAKPAGAKADYIKSIVIAPTQGPGFRLSVSGLGI
ncbi:MAG: 50S ribosomal protein L1 [Candidatus Omnitrophica bacterium]|nr:50S ribosomal protein L1 [Candidatus Omnitrophota bacterium]